MNGLEMVQGFIARGYTPAQAAALAGHALQESGGNAASVNPKEDAHGLLQFRLDRWDNLQKFAKDSGRSPTDPEAQMDFIRHEMTNGSEAKAGAGFLAAPDVASASAALRPYIRFGDNSAGTRLNNATNLYSQIGGAPVGALATGAAPAPVDPTNPADPTQSVAAPSAPLSLAASAAAPVGSLASSLGDLGKSLGGGQQQQAAAQSGPDFLAPQQIAMPQARTGQSAQIANAIARSYGFI